MAGSSSKGRVPSSWQRAESTRSSTRREIIHHEQRQHRGPGRRRLVEGADPAECCFWKRLLLRKRTDLSAFEKQGSAGRGPGQSCLLLRRLFVCGGIKRQLFCGRFHTAEWRTSDG